MPLNFLASSFEAHHPDAKLLDQRTFACVPVAEHFGTKSAPKVEEQIRA